ncbi:sugar transferase [Pelagicoccus albus]|uniref:Sugar transferase n=1 Tax=Pelagicoccus albus TaxID=415222 RepID=A0A7X1B6G5_9BACT|nr:sugar transferase [Pelagicoccus albus]MBC2606264.1 sugar transferase [Pelagicoccus albus]
MTRSKSTLYNRTCTSYSVLLFLGDLATVALSLYLGYFLRFTVFATFRPVAEFPSFGEYKLHVLLAVFVYALIAHNQRLYRWSVVVSRSRSLAQVFRVAALWAFAVVGTSLMMGLSPDLSRFYMVCSMACLVVMLSFWRLFMHAVLHHSRLFAGVEKSIALVGTGEMASNFAESIKSGRAGLHQFAGFVTTGPRPEGRMKSSDVLGELDDLEALMGSGRFESVVVCDETISNSKLLEIAKLCERNFVDFKTVPRTFEVFSSCLQVVSMGNLRVMSLSDVPQNRFVNRAIKRSFDFVGACFGLMLSLPLYAVLIPLVKRESPGPVFYKQVRSGLGGKPFEIYKIRSMRQDAESGGQVGWSTEVDPRRTKIGTFMRKWNLDEIPQFWNVLKGDMSLVGPRPERPELIQGFLEEIPYYQSRHSVKPGMTGWAQVNGLRGDTSISERIRYDLQYIESWSVWMDLSIQFRTIFNYKGAC